MTADYTAMRMDDMEQAMGGLFRRVRAELGVTSFGLQLLELQPGMFYAKHNHAHDNQEEVYVGISGGGHLDIEGQMVRLDPGVAIRVGPGTTREAIPDEGGMTFLAIGGVAGGDYEAPDFTELGGPDPSPPPA